MAWNKQKIKCLIFSLGGKPSKTELLQARGPYPYRRYARSQKSFRVLLWIEKTWWKLYQCCRSFEIFRRFSSSGIPQKIRIRQGKSAGCGESQLKRRKSLWVCLMVSKWYGWTVDYSWFKFTYKVTCLWQVWRLKVQLTQNAITALSNLCTDWLRGVSAIIKQIDYTT